MENSWWMLIVAILSILYFTIFLFLIYIYVIKISNNDKSKFIKAKFIGNTSYCNFVSGKVYRVKIYSKDNLIFVESFNNGYIPYISLEKLNEEWVLVNNVNS